MAADRSDAVEALLVEAEQAHGAYEATELNGVYDEQWPRWYAAYALEHGLVTVLGHDVSVDRLSRFLADCYADFDQADPKPAASWSAYIAGRITSEL